MLRLPASTSLFTRVALSCVTASLLALSACQDATAPTPTGSVIFDLTGLPDGNQASVSLRRGSTTKTVEGSKTLDGLDAGEWTVSAQSVTIDGLEYAPEPATQTITVPSRSTGSARVVWTPTRGSVALTIQGLPQGVDANVLLSSNSFSRVLTSSTSITALVPGSYTLTARDVRAPGGTYRATVSTQTLTVAASAVAVQALVTYEAAPAAVDVTVAGLPGGTTANITLTAPNGGTVPVGGSTRLSPVSAGRWRLSAAAVQSGGFTYSPSPSAFDTTVSAGDTLRFPVSYGVSTGALAVAMTGLPQGSTGSVTVTGPGGFSQSLTATTTLTNLTPGTYTVAADSVVRSGFAYRPTPASQQIVVAASLSASPANVAYAAVSGTLVVTLSGVPNGASGSARITGPYGVDRTITASTVITPTPAGPYVITGAPFTFGGLTYSVSPSTINRTVTIAGRDSIDLRYTAASGSLQVTVSGLPGGTNAALTLSGNAQNINITGSTTLSALAVGSYTLTASTVNVSGTNYVPTPSTQNVSITNGIQSTASVTYAAVATTGSVVVTINGLPGGTNANVTLSGNAQNIPLTASGTISNLTAGSYTLTASNVSSAGNNYTAAPTSQNVTITGGAQSAATVTYTLNNTIDFTVNSAYFTQATQKPDGSVALVAGRDALLRVFVTANIANTQTPTVRARIYDGASLLQTLTLTGPVSGVPTSVNEGVLSSSWNTVVTGANIGNALRVLVDVDPTNAIAEGDETNNTWPSSGTPQSITVNTVPAFNVRFVPVTVKTLTGNVTTGNMNSFLTTARKVWPILTVNSDVRAPFVSSADTLISTDGNSNWLTVLSEMNTLRATDGAPATTHYYGVVKVAYTSGVAGYGYVPGRAAMGWDYLPSGDGVAAHEWGHNFNRPHAPCGGAASPDPTYPYSGAQIGMWGWNSGTNTLVNPTSTLDLMSYCNPTWVSDYNWTKVMTYRQSSGAEASVTSGEGLLVWGRVVDGKVILEPSFRVNAPASRPVSRPTHYVDALDATGNVLLNLPIDAEVVDHVTGHTEQQFAVIVPWSETLEQSLATVRVRDARTPLLAAVRSSAVAMAARVSVASKVAQPIAQPDPTPAVDVLSANRARVRWNSAAYPMAMLRDGTTGKVMGFVRTPGAEINTGGRAVEVVYSDGVRSVVRKLR